MMIVNKLRVLYWPKTVSERDEYTVELDFLKNYEIKIADYTIY